MKALIFRKTGEPKSVLPLRWGTPLPGCHWWRSTGQSPAQSDQRIRSAHGACGRYGYQPRIAGQPGH